MADMPTTPPLTHSQSALGLVSDTWTRLAAFVFRTPPKAMSPEMIKDMGLEHTAPFKPLSQDAATALHLMSLGQWY